MLYEKKYFGNGSGNFDDVDFLLLPNQWVNLENARVGSTDKGVTGTVESIGSNVLLSSVQPSVTFVQIGAIEDGANRRFFYFLKDLYGPWDKIICYDADGGVFFNVLFSAQVTGGLNFSKDHVIHSGSFINGLLYWTDFLNQPRRINVEAGINLNHPGTFPNTNPYTDPLSAEVITIIRKPPVYPILYEKITNVNINTNQIENNAFRFTYQYVYRDGEFSTLSPHSLLAAYNYPANTYNAIRITISLSEIPDQDVQIINVIVIYAEGEQAFIIKSWNKANSTDATEIANHVAGITALNFEFANDSIGSAIDGPTLVKPFDSIPLLSETLEQGTNRLFLGRNLLGYDTPVETGLTLQIVSTSGGGTITGEWRYVNVYYEFNETSPEYWSWFFAYFPIAIDNSHPAGYYDLSATRLFYNNGGGGPVPSLPSSINITDYVFAGLVPSGDIYSYILIHDVNYLDYAPTFETYVETYSVGNPLTTTGSGATTNTGVLKSDSPYRLGIVFYDQYLRQCGVAVGSKITTPDRGYTSPNYNYGIQWTLPIGIQIAQIPDWAYYYSIVSTKSLRTSFFVQSRAGSIVYATKDSSGNYAFTSTSYADTNAGLALKLDLLVGAGMGYSFQQNDIIKIYISGGSTIYSLAVIDQSGEWVISELANLGSLAGVNAFFEIYTPTPQSAGEFYYETGSMYQIINPTTVSRSFSTISGFVPGDIYLLTKGTVPSDYITENMSPNVTFWRNWFTNAGRIQIMDSIGQRFKDTSIKWSNTFIPGTITNGLSSFDALDEKILPGELGPLRKLIITSKVNNEQGAVMLGVCEQETASIYLGETQLIGSAANAFIASSTGVIGTVNILKGSFGTKNPESVTEFRGNAYWVDLLNGKVIQYSLNGLFPISNYKMTRYWKLFSEQYLSMTGEQIEALGSRPFIFTTVDPHHWELLVTVPKLLESPPMGNLPDMPDYIYPFDIWDGQAKTLVYKINAEPNFWQGSYSFTQEGYITIQNTLYSFKHGQLYQHNNTDTYGNFNGIQYTSRIMFVCNQQPERPKVYDNMSVEANMLPTLTYFMSLFPYMQVSNLQDFDWQNKEGVLYSQIYRNVLTPTATGLVTNALVKGEKMRTYAFRVMLEFTVSTFPVELRFTTLGYQLSLGHSIPTQ